MTTLGRSLRLFGRALRLRCPNCGRGPLLEGWLRVRPRCPVCGLRFERGEQGYQVGAYMFNLIAAELHFGAVFLAIVLLTWPSTSSSGPPRSRSSGDRPATRRASPDGARAARRARPKLARGRRVRAGPARGQPEDL